MLLALNIILGEFSPVGTVVSNANSPGASGVTYGLIKHGTNPLQIDTSTGQVTLGSALDYETANNFRYQVTATKGGETRTSGIITYQVNDEYYTMPSFNSTSVTNTNFVGNRMLEVTNKYWHHSSTQSNPAISAWIPNDLGKKDAAGRVIADFGQGLPAGTTYELSFPDTSSMSGAAVLGCGGGDCFEIDSNGVLRVAAGKILNSPQTGEFRGKNLSSNAAGMESTMINKLAGFSQNGYQWRDNYGARISVRITPPNESSSYPSIHIKPVRTEAQENVVMRFGNNLIDTGGGQGADSKPFSIERYTKRRMAHNTSIQLECCTDSYGRDMTAWGGSISESVLVSHQLEGNTKLASATTMVGGGTAYYGQSNGAKTYYRTNTVANGLNENDTNILDFEYRFPVDNAHNGHSVTGTDKTKGVYAPLAVANAQWDGQMSANEQARYGCYNSGQGCGSGTHELSISGSMVQSTETTLGTFSGYQVKDWNLNMNSTSSGANGNHLLNADNNGASPGSGTGVNSLLALGKNKNGETRNTANFSGGEAEYHTITLPESFNYFGNTFTHLHINENGFVSFDTDTSKPYDNAGINNLSSGNNRGGFPLQYFDETKHFEGGNSPMDGSLIPEKWGKPGTSYEGNFDNSIFALLGGYNTEDYNGETNWSIRTLWNSATKIFTVGWYNLRSGKSTEDNAEVNLEIQFNMNDDSFKIVHGKFGGRFPDATTNADSGFSTISLESAKIFLV